MKQDLETLSGAANADSAAPAEIETSADGSLGEAPGDGSDTSGKGRPRRYKLYDRIADNVSVRTMNIIITVVAVLIVVLLIYGIITGTPPQ